MHGRLTQEMHENGPLKEKIKGLESDTEANMKTFEEIRNIIDDR